MVSSGTWEELGRKKEEMFKDDYGHFKTEISEIFIYISYGDTSFMMWVGGKENSFSLSVCLCVFLIFVNLVCNCAALERQ